MLLDDSILLVLIKTHILDYQSYIKIHQILKKKWKISEVILNCPSIPCGIERCRLWQKSLFMNNNLESIEKDKLEYFRIKETLCTDELTSISTGTSGDIMRDVGRTFQKQVFFHQHQIGYTLLLNILLSVVNTRPDIGYCQGMNYVAATLLLGRLPTCYSGINISQHTLDDLTAIDNIDSNPISYETNEDRDNKAIEMLTPMSKELSDDVEADVYCMMIELLRPGSTLDMSGLWRESIPKLKLRIYQLDRLLRWTFPHLHSHFTSIELSPEVITAQWFLTLFTYTFPIYPIVLQMWDFIFLTGWEGVFKLSLGLLGSMQERLLQIEDFEGVALLMREWKRHDGKMVIQEPLSQLLRRADGYIVNQEVLLRLQEAFANEIISVALITSSPSYHRDPLRKTQQHQQHQQQIDVGHMNKEGSSNNTDTSKSAFMKSRSMIQKTFSAKKYFNGIKLNSTKSTSSQPGKTKAGEYNSIQDSDDSGKSFSDNSNIDTISDTTITSTTIATTTVIVPDKSYPITNQSKVITTIVDTGGDVLMGLMLPTEQQLLQGAEQPSFWLLQYGSKLSTSIVQELRRIKTDLILLDQQVDTDKQQIQAKIIRSCELHRETQEELALAEQSYAEAEQRVLKGEEDRKSSLLLAQDVAMQAVKLIEFNEEEARQDLKYYNDSISAAAADNTTTTMMLNTIQINDTTTVLVQEPSTPPLLNNEATPLSTTTSDQPIEKIVSVVATGSGSSGGTDSQYSHSPKKSTSMQILAGSSVRLLSAVKRSIKHFNNSQSDHNQTNNDITIGNNNNNSSNNSSNSNSAFSSNSTNNSITSNADMVSNSAANASQGTMKELEKLSHVAQQQIIDIERYLEDARWDLEYSKRRLEQAMLSNEEACNWKNSLCEQLHQLVKDSNR